MPNEFVARNGLISQNNIIVSGSVNIAGSSGTLFTSNTDTLEVTGSLLVTGSAIFTGSVSVSSGITGSLLGTSSYANNADTLDGLDSSAFASTSSFQNYTSSANAGLTALNAQTASLLNYTSSTDAKISSIYTTTASLNASVAGLNLQTASLLNYTASNNANIASIYTTTASLNASVAGLNTYSASLNNKTSSFATTGSNTFTGTQTITGSLNVSSNITTPGTITATTLVVQTITSSQNFITGSTKFGILTSNTHQFTGSVSASGSLAINTNVLYVDGTNVGIGTTSPAYKLHVNGGDVGTSGFFNARYNSSNETYKGTFGWNHIQLGNNGSNDIIAGRTATGGAFRFIVNQTGSYSYDTYDGIIAMTIKADGNVGIGTTTAQNLLHVRSGASGLSSYDSRYKVVLENNGEAYYAVTVPDNSYAGLRILGTSSSPRGAVEYYMTDNLLHVYATGSIRFYNGVAESMRILSGGSVGIGTTSPSARLHISGDGSSYNLLRLNHNGTGTNGFLDISVTDTRATISTNYSSTNIPLEIKSYGNTNQLFLATDGNVGIGTSNPTRTLHILGPSGIGSVLKLEGASGTTTYLQLSYNGATNSQSGYIGYDSSANMPFFTNNTERIRIQSDGNVGIATTSPTALLHVQGLGSSGGDSVYITNRRGGYFPLRVLVTQGDYQGVLIEHEDGTGSGGPGPSGSYGFKFDDKRVSGTYTGHPSASFVIARSNTYNNTNIFEVRPYNSAPSIAVATGGNVGIGSTSPAYKLDVTGTGRFTGKVIIGAGSSATSQLDVTSDTSANGITLRNRVNDDYAFLNWRSYDGTELLAEQYIQRTAANTATLRHTINNGGTPATYLTILATGAATFANSVTAQTNLGFINTNASQAGFVADYTGTGALKVSFSTYNDFMNIYNETNGYSIINFTRSTKNIAINPTGGNVGIGTSAPAYKFQSNGPSGDWSGYFKGSSTSNNSYGLFIDAGTTSADSPFMVRSADGGTVFLRILGNGNVGIGTTSPTDELQVVATSGNGITITTNDVTTLKMRSTGGTKNWGFATTNLAASDFGIYQSTSGGGDPISAGTARLYFDGSGNVGIGTTSPAYQLQVLNTIGLRANSTNFQAIRGTYWGYSTSYPVVMLGHQSTGSFTTVAIGYDPSGNANGAFSGDGREVLFRRGAQFVTPNAANNSFNLYNLVLLDGAVGIGTASPGYTLDISGNLRTTTGTYLAVNSSNVIIGGTTSDLIGSFKFMTIGNTAFQYGGSSGTYLRIEPGSADTEVALKADARSGAYPPMTFYTTATERMRIKADGNVGIGTTSPGYTLDVRGTFGQSTTSTQPVLIYGDSGDTNGLFRIQMDSVSDSFGSGARTFLGDGGIDIFIGTGNSSYTPANTYIALNHSGEISMGAGSATKHLVISTGGSIGIGTTSFGTSLLNVNGNIGLAGDTTRYFYMPEVNQGTGSIYMQAGFGSSQAGGALRLYGHNATSYTGGDVEVGLSGKGNFLINSTIGGTRLVTVNINGNVGIGTTSPTSRLEVTAPNTGTTTNYASKNIIANSPLVGGYTGAPIVSMLAMYDGSIHGADIGYLYDATGYGLVFSVNNDTVGNPIEAMRINRAGNIGIGTTSPGSNLHIKGSNDGGADFGAEVRVWENTFGASLQGSTQGNTAAFVGNFRYNFTTAGSSIQNYPNAGQGILFKDGIHVYSSNPGGSGGGTFTPSERLTIKTDGNVGIGTTSPSSILHILDTSANDTTLIIGAAGEVPIIKAGGANTDLQLEAVGAGGYLNFVTNGSSRMLIQGGGNVGIGTTSPGWKLHIEGTTGTSIQDPLLALKVTTANNTSGILFINSGNASSFNDLGGIYARIYSGNAKGYLGFYTRNSDGDNSDVAERMRIISDGNVGINSTSPGYKLDVNGTARFGAVIVGSLGTGTVYSNGGTLTNTNPSDRNLKENIAPINYGLNEILQLDPVTFNWKDNININKQFGFIAQDVQEVMPDAVVEGEYLGLEKDAIYTALINAIKELKAEIDELKNK